MKISLKLVIKNNPINKISLKFNNKNQLPIRLAHKWQLKIIKMKNRMEIPKDSISTVLL